MPDVQECKSIGVSGLRVYRRTLQRIPAFDYYLYTGIDEGSMGYLDALAAGVATIGTPQGFHLDVPGGITHAFTEASELIAVFAGIAAERNRRMDGVKGLTWESYAREHVRIWRDVLEGRALAPLPPPDSAALGAPRAPSGMGALRDDLRFYAAPVVNRLKRLVHRG